MCLSFGLQRSFAAIAKWLVSRLRHDRKFGVYEFGSSFKQSVMVETGILIFQRLCKLKELSLLVLSYLIFRILIKK